MNAFEENPFDLTKASDFTDTQIYQYWVDMTARNNERSLIELIKPRSVMPMILLGSKGCGKTHLMRYCSEPVQLMRNNNDIIETIKNDGYLGIYVRADSLNTGRFFGKGQNEETWYLIFSYYFEIWICLCLFELIKKIVKYISNEEENDLVKSILNLINIKVKNIDSIENLVEYFEEIRKNIDNIVNNCAITRKIEKFDFIFTHGDMIFGIPKLLNKNIGILKDTIFLYLFDEIENFSEIQQIFINTLIRYRRGMATIRIGARLYGIKTFKTYPQGEMIKERAEFEKVEFDKFLGDNNKYPVFIKNLIKKRLGLVNHGQFIEKTTDINNFFEEIKSDDYYKNETLKIVSVQDKKKKERLYFTKLRENIKKYTSEKQIEKIINNLSISDYPLLEKMNVYIFYKFFLKSNDLIELSIKINDEVKAFINDDKQKYYQYYQHFNNDMLAQLYRDYERNIPYAGLETIIHLSQGAPRNALSILKNIHRRAIFNGEEPFFSNKRITIKSQSEGIADTSEWFWNDVQQDNNGILVRNAIDKLAILFRSIRYCYKPTECDLSSFSIDIDALSEKVRKTIIDAENWSFLLRQKSGRNSKNTQQKKYSFQIAPILAPKWGLSQRRGGTIELSNDLAEIIFSDIKEKFSSELNKRLKNVSFEFNKVIYKSKIKNKDEADTDEYYNGGLFAENEN